MSSFPRLVVCSALIVLAGGTARVFAEASSASPFLPQDGAAGPNGAAPSGTHELVGMISSNKQTLVGITNKATRKSVWIPVGKSVEGIEVISCDPKQDRAVVSINGQLETLVMHASSPSGVAAPVPVAAPGQSTAAVGTKAEQEREARMLVSDLMEIGMQQRKAYEAAQKANAAKGYNPSSAQPATPIAPK